MLAGIGDAQINCPLHARSYDDNRVILDILNKLFTILTLHKLTSPLQATLLTKLQMPVMSLMLLRKKRTYTVL